MAFPPAFLEEIRNRLTCSSVVGRRVRLVKKGREFSGLCPFHNEKSPSFFVNDDKGFFHCFGCGAHGDVIGFSMRIDNLSFPEAVERLAEEAGLEVPRASPREFAREEQRKTLGDVVEAAARWYEQQLWGGAGRPGLEYFRARGLSDQTIRDFRLGYAPDGRDGLRQTLRKQGYEDTLLLEAALIVKPDDGRDAFDFFRGRVMFPITDRRGRVIAFGGRILGDGQPKYLNSRDTPLFDKGRNLYALDKARAGLKDGGDVVVAEGYMDVIALHAGGFRGAVAPLGTALTEGQLELVWRLADEPIICLDGDAAGQRAARRAAERALPLIKPGKSLRFATLPTGEDPDSLLRGGGRDRLRECLDAAQPLVEVIWSVALGDNPVDTPERRAAFQAELHRQTQAIADPIVREEYQRRFKDLFWDRLRRRPVERRPRPNAERGQPPASLGMRAGSPPSAVAAIERLLAIAILYPRVLEHGAEQFASLEISAPALAVLRRSILEAHDAQVSLDRAGLRLHLNAAGHEGIVARLLGSRLFKGLDFVRKDDEQAAATDWQMTLTRVHERQAHEELRRIGDVPGEEMDEAWLERLEETRREVTRTQALELEDEPPFAAPEPPRGQRTTH